jgi:hypothetical protein
MPFSQTFIFIIPLLKVILNYEKRYSFKFPFFLRLLAPCF